jgi:hypothetical protein
MANDCKSIIDIDVDWPSIEDDLFVEDITPLSLQWQRSHLSGCII